LFFLNLFSRDTSNYTNYVTVLILFNGLNTVKAFNSFTSFTLESYKLYFILEIFYLLEIKTQEIRYLGLGVGIKKKRVRKKTKMSFFRNCEVCQMYSKHLDEG
jgi:hypothetical protein